MSSQTFGGEEGPSTQPSAQPSKLGTKGGKTAAAGKKKAAGVPTRTRAHLHLSVARLQRYLTNCGISRISKLTRIAFAAALEALMLNLAGDAQYVSRGKTLRVSHLDAVLRNHLPQSRGLASMVHRGVNAKTSAFGVGRVRAINQNRQKKTGDAVGVETA